MSAEINQSAIAQPAPETLAVPLLDAVDATLNVVTNHPVKMLSLLAMARDPERDHTEVDIQSYLLDAQDELGPRRRVPALLRLLTNSLVAADLATITSCRGVSGSRAQALRLTEIGREFGPAVMSNGLDLELRMPAFSSQRIWGMANNNRQAYGQTVLQPLFRLRMLQRLIDDPNPLSVGDFYTSDRADVHVHHTMYALEAEGVLEVLRKTNPAHRRLQIDTPAEFPKSRLRNMSPQGRALRASLTVLHRQGVRSINGQSLMDEILGSYPALDVALVWRQIVDMPPPHLKFVDSDMFGEGIYKKSRMVVAPSFREPIAWLLKGIEAIRAGTEYRTLAAAQGERILEDKAAVSYLMNKASLHAAHTSEAGRQEAKKRDGDLRARVAHWISLPQRLTFGPEWGLDAACRNYSASCREPGPRDTSFEDPDLFFPLDDFRPVATVAQDVAAAKEVCADCPVRLPCLQWSRTKPEPYGVWGGLTAEERRTQQLSPGMLALLDLVELRRLANGQSPFVAL